MGGVMGWGACVPRLLWSSWILMGGGSKAPVTAIWTTGVRMVTVIPVIPSRQALPPRDLKGCDHLPVMCALASLDA